MYGEGMLIGRGRVGRVTVQAPIPGGLAALWHYGTAQGTAEAPLLPHRPS